MNKITGIWLSIAFIVFSLSVAAVKYAYAGDFRISSEQVCALRVLMRVLMRFQSAPHFMFDTFEMVCVCETVFLWKIHPLK